MSGIKQQLVSLEQDSSGSVLPMVAAGSILLLALVGGGVDMSRAYKTKARLQAACDAGVLAGRRSVTRDGYDQKAQEAADKYFAVNYDETKQDTSGTIFNSSSDDDGNTVDGTASTRMPMRLMQIFGHQGMTLEVGCTSTMGVGNADVMMVLDTTGSMAWQADGTTTVDTKKGQTSRLTDLQVAMKNFYATLADASEGSNARIRYGFVPYTQSVNVGRLLPQNYIVDTWAIQSREALWVTKTDWSTPVGAGANQTETNDSNTGWTDLVLGYTTLNSCNTARASLGTAWEPDGTATVSSSDSISGDGNTKTTTKVTTQKQRRISSSQCVSYTQNRNTRYKIQVIYNRKTVRNYEYSESQKITWEEFDKWRYRQRSYDVSQYKTGATVMIQNPALKKGDVRSAKEFAPSAKWPGCIEERETSRSATFSFSTITGMSPKAADLDLDSAPHSEATKWAPMWPDVAWYRTQTSSSSRPYDVATSDFGRSADVVDCPAEAQNLQVMTEGEFKTYADSLTAVGATYHDIGITWGGRMLSPDGIFSSIVNEAPANGGNVARHLIFMTDGELAPNDYIQSAWGVEAHDKRVTSDGSDTQSKARHTSRFLALCEAIKAKGIRIWVVAFGTSLTNDLKTCASSSSAYPASNPTQLNNAFQEIAKQVGELRMAK